MGTWRGWWLITARDNRQNCRDQRVRWLKDLGLPPQPVLYVYRHRDENTQTCDREGQANQGVLDRRKFFPPPRSIETNFPVSEAARRSAADTAPTMSGKISKQITSLDLSGNRLTTSVWPGAAGNGGRRGGRRSRDRVLPSRVCPSRRRRRVREIREQLLSGRLWHAGRPR